MQALRQTEVQCHHLGASGAISSAGRVLPIQRGGMNVPAECRPPARPHGQCEMALTCQSPASALLSLLRMDRMVLQESRADCVCSATSVRSPRLGQDACLGLGWRPTPELSLQLLRVPGHGGSPPPSAGRSHARAPRPTSSQASAPDSVPSVANTRRPLLYLRLCSRSCCAAQKAFLQYPQRLRLIPSLN